MKLTIIAAHDLNHGIGYHNQLPWRLPADLAFFKASTYGKPILMGRKTFESIGRPLPGRQNMVLTRQALTIAGVEIVTDMKQLHQREVMIIGGASIYQQFLPLVDEMLITEVQATTQVDSYFPAYDKALFEETVINQQPADDNNQYAMIFKRYIRK